MRDVKGGGGMQGERKVTRKGREEGGVKKKDVDGRKGERKEGREGGGHKKGRRE